MIGMAAILGLGLLLQAGPAAAQMSGMGAPSGTQRKAGKPGVGGSRAGAGLPSSRPGTGMSGMAPVPGGGGTGMAGMPSTSVAPLPRPGFPSGMSGMGGLSVLNGSSAMSGMGSGAGMSGRQDGMRGGAGMSGMRNGSPGSTQGMNGMGVKPGAGGMPAAGPPTSMSDLITRPGMQSKPEGMGGR
jgi:hypothetical protein